VLGARATERLAVLDAVGGVRARAVGPEEIAERLPPLARFDGPALLDEDAGAIRAQAAVTALSGALGDRLVEDEVLALWPRAGGGVEVRTGGDRQVHDAVVVCAGRGTARLARGLGVAVPTRLAVHGRVTFAVAGEPPEHLSCLQDSSDAWGEPGTYAAPSPGNARFSLGVAGEVEAHEDGALLDPAGLAKVTDRAAAYVRRALPGLDPRPVGVRHCWVSALPWHEDGLAVWEAEDVLLVAGGNLFKHAPALGRRLAAAVLGEGLAPELRPEARLGAPVA
jgi:sarcosine oxidase